MLVKEFAPLHKWAPYFFLRNGMQRGFRVLCVHLTLNDLEVNTCHAGLKKQLPPPIHFTVHIVALEWP